MEKGNIHLENNKVIIMNKFLSILIIVILVTALSFTSYSFINNNVINFILNFVIVFIGAILISKLIKSKNQ